MELRFVILNNAVQVYTGIIALLFTVLGLWLARVLFKPKINTVIIEKEIFPGPASAENFTPDGNWLRKSGLSARELEVLNLIAAGMSNKEIAEKLFLSLPTIKSHSANLFDKLQVKRRTEAVNKARHMGIIP